MNIADVKLKAIRSLKVINTLRASIAVLTLILIAMTSVANAKNKIVNKKEFKVSTKTEFAILGGGCFWGMEDLLRRIPGVISTEVGYAGGRTESPTYIQVKTGTTGHAEVVKIEFDPKQVSYEALLVEFFKMHDPTTANRQGNDIGTQYRSIIFYFSDAQKTEAEKMMARVNKSNAWGARVTTELQQAGSFTKAEDYHQDYLVNNPGGYTCHYMRNIKF
jgi:peptide-methionine (S)-S-oxide reductase